MTLRELKAFDGREGKPAYIAYRGRVYDVSGSPLWQSGEHEGLHRAGEDLTPMLGDAPHGEEVFARYPVVGTLDAAASPPPSAAADPSRERQRRWQAWYHKYHPHPMLVHFPIALHLFAAATDLLFFAAPKAAYAAAVFYTFFAATVTGAAAMLPGILSWKINYGYALTRPFIVKLAVSVAMLFAGVAAIVLYLEASGVVYTLRAEGIVYHAVVLLTGAGVIVLGYYGGKITWGGGGKAVRTAQDAGAAAVRAAAPAEEAAAQTLPPAGRYEVPFACDSAAPHVRLPLRRAERTGALPRTYAILIGGAAGAGIDTLEKLLSDAFKRSGYYLFSTKEYMSRVRGGSNTALIRIADGPVEAPCRDVDLFIALDADALGHARTRLTPSTLVLADESAAADRDGVTALAMKAAAQRLGGPRYMNTYAAGALFGLLGLEETPLLESIAARFGEDEANTAAAKEGRTALRGPDTPAVPLPAPGAAAALRLMDGSTAAGFGFLAGGCNFVASYPMSPSTGVLNFMAGMSKRFDIAVEQSEDEIASIHLVMGAWYAGARALTTTSGGGFALMGEGISLSGMTETPAVIYLAQRPGPATGLPTRSEQGDLNLALHSGHGPFPRILLAPGSLRECIELGYLAFELADRHQVPVIFLSDQYLADSMAMIDAVDFAAFEPRRYIAAAEEAYRRYEDSPSGISPRGVPGHGDGVIVSVGDEHDERGQITEAAEMRDRMVAKRARKAAGITAEALPPERIGEGSIAVIGWGSTRAAIAEALSRLGDGRVMQVHFAWVHPLDPGQLGFLEACDFRIVVENNADGAFADRLRLMGVNVDAQVLQHDGFAFFADVLARRLETLLKEVT